MQLIKKASIARCLQLLVFKPFSLVTQAFFKDSVKIVDKLTKVDMEAAASAGDIATAMAETATSAKLSGVSMDKLIGYITNTINPRDCNTNEVTKLVRFPPRWRVKIQSELAQ